MWICKFCGWENYQDDKIARQEPSCVKCGFQKDEMETKIKECELHLGEITLKLIDAKESLENLAEMKEALESESATQTRAYEGQLDVVRGLKCELEEYENVLLKCQPAVYIRGQQEDQAKLIGWVE